MSGPDSAQSCFLPTCCRADRMFYDIATNHKTPKVKRWLARRKCDRFEMHANFTWKWQLVDVALAINLFYKIFAQIHIAYVYFGCSVQE